MVLFVEIEGRGQEAAPETLQQVVSRVEQRCAVSPDQQQPVAAHGNGISACRQRGGQRRLHIFDRRPKSRGQDFRHDDNAVGGLDLYPRRLHPAEMGGEFFTAKLLGRAVRWFERWKSLRRLDRLQKATAGSNVTTAIMSLDLMCASDDSPLVVPARASSLQSPAFSLQSPSAAEGIGTTPVSSPPP